MRTTQFLLPGVLLLFASLGNANRLAAAPQAAVNLKAPVRDEVLPQLRAMLLDYRRYAETLWQQPVALDATQSMGFWGSGRGEGGNEGARAVTNTALVYALLFREGDRAFSVAQRIAPALRYTAATHVSGAQKGTDGKQWGNSWQSAMWAGNLGMAAWLVRDQLDEATLAAVNRVVAFEADRFIDQKPPSMAPGDTKAEENAWDLTASSSALLLMPDHPHAGAWHQTVLRYGFNSLSVPADQNSTQMADGKMVRDWVSTVQQNPDFTLENHRIFHPVYAMVAPATLAQAAVAYRLGGKPVPQALQHSVVNGWNMLRYVALPDGEWLYPQGLDWDLHDYEHLHYWTMLGTLYRDPLAALLEKRTVGYARKRQILNGDGRFVGPSSSLGFAREAVQAERVAFSLLMHQVFEPPAPTNAMATTMTDQAQWQRAVSAMAPVRAFDGAGFVVHRTPRGVLSFSWKNRLMGLATPQSQTHLDAPYVTTPLLTSLTGRFTLQEPPDKNSARFQVLRQAVATDKNGFSLAIESEINNGALRQQIAVASLEPGILVYLDRVVAQKDVTVLEEQGLPLSIENDEVSGNQRRLSTQEGSQLLTGGQEKQIALAGHWANIDGRLGLIAPDSPLLYKAAGKPNRAGAREDILFGSWKSGARTFKVGETVAERASLWILDSSPAETARIAASTQVERGPNGITVRFTAPDKRRHSLRLDGSGAANWNDLTIAPTVLSPIRSSGKLPQSPKN